MTKLRWIGPRTPGAVLPLPEGWPARDHDEPDQAVAAEKLASGLFATVEPEKPAEPAEKPQEVSDGDSD